MTDNATNATDVPSDTFDEDVLAFAIILALALLSLVTNILFAYMAVQNKKINRALVWFYISLTIFDSGGLALFAFYTAPLTLT